ncbi:MAG: alpha/beta hydrolase [Nocardioides sp.]|nr:alpha/beta hydrolase [Nocardioides sp.]
MTRWLIDDRPATRWTRAYVRGMWLARDKRAFEGAAHTLRTAWARQQGGDAPPTRWTRARRRATRREVAGMAVWSVAPRRTAPAVRVVYVHGGGYVHPLTSDYWRLVRALSSAPAEVLVPAYPLAPGARVDEVLPRLLEVVRSTTEQQPDLPLVLMGDSAGGALVLVLARLLQDRHGLRADAVVPLSPWLDARLDEERVTELEATDPMLAETGLRAAGRWWAGVRDTGDPLVSPVHASLAELPPVELWIGEHDILRPAVDTLAERADRDGCDLTVHEVPAMFHVWMTRAIPEARRTRQALVALLRRVSGAGGRGAGH